MNFKVFVGFVMAFLFLPIVFAAQDTIINVVQAGEDGLVVVYPESLVFKQGMPANFSFDVLNTTYYRLSGALVNCTFNSVDNHGEIVVAGYPSYSPALRYWYYPLNASDNSLVGTYGWYIHCNNSKYAGYASFVYLITKTGKVEIENDNTGGVAVTIFFLAISVMLFLIPFFVNFTKRKNNYTVILNNLLKKLVWIISMFMFSLTLTLVSSIAKTANIGITDEIHTVLQISLWADYLFLVFVILSFMFDTILMLVEESKFKRMGGGEEE